MSRKKKRSRGNPANQVWRDGSTLGDAIMQWAVDAMFAAKGDPDRVAIFGAIAGWVGFGNPGKLGLGQCIQATYQLRLVLEAIGVESRMVPVTVRALDSSSGHVLAGIGSPRPEFAEGFSRWTGHVVLYLPGQGRIIDPTIGQAFSNRTKPWQMPLVGRVAQASTSVDADTPGAMWLVRRDHYTAEYTVLDPQYNPLAHDQLIEGLSSITQRLRDRLPAIVQRLRDLQRAVSP